MSKNSLRNVAYDYLYNSIVTSKLLPGQPIVEQEISDMLGISRTPVREALKQLTAEWLVKYIPGRGTFVEEIYKSDVEEIFELREMFEDAALKSAIYEITDEEIDKMMQNLESLNCKKSSEEFYNCDRALHNLIMKYGHNRRMLYFYNSTTSQLERLRRVSAMTPNRLQASTKEHLEILSAIKERNLYKATEKLNIHLNNVKKSIFSICEQMNLNYKGMI